MSEIKALISELDEKHPGREYGCRYNVQIVIDGVYAGIGRYCVTMDEVKAFCAKWVVTIMQEGEVRL